MFLSCSLQLSKVLSYNLQLSNVFIFQLATQQCSCLAACDLAISDLVTHNLAMFLSCNLQLTSVPILQQQLSNTPILQFATYQRSCLATCNLAMLFSCNFQLICTLERYSYHATQNVAMSLSCNLQQSNVSTLQFTTEQRSYLAAFNLSMCYLAPCNLATFLFGKLQLRKFSTFPFATR